MPREKLANVALLLALFLLPWQTRWIFWQVPLNGQPWEYGQLSLYAVEFLLVISWALLGRLRLPVLARRFVRPAFALLAACCFAGAFSVSPLVSAGMLIQIASAVLLFFLLSDERVSGTEALLAFASGLVIPALLGWWQVITGASPSASWFGLAPHLAETPGASVVETAEGARTLRAYGTLPHPNVFGGYLAVGLWALMALYSRLRLHPSRAWLALPAMLFASALVSTFSRGAWLALIAGVVVLAGFLLWGRKLPPHDALPIAFGAFAALIATVVLFHAAILTRTAPAARLEAKSFAERAAGYQAFPDVLAANSVTGTGIGAYTAALAAAHPGGAAFDYQPIHNAFLLFLGETGILGLVGGIWFLKQLAETVWQKPRLADRAFAVSALAILLVLALFDHYLWSLWSGLALGAFVLASVTRGKEDSIGPTRRAPSEEGKANL